MTLRIEPQIYGRVAAQARRDGQSLNATTSELLECWLEVFEAVDAEASNLDAGAK
jgi:predicted HicB family RNase H-like nuclease